MFRGNQMKDGKTPNPNVIHPIKGYDNEIYIKPTIKNPNIIVGDFSYIADSDFESHVTHFYDWNGDKLIIGKFCQIASGVEFVMNGANHQINAVSTLSIMSLTIRLQILRPITHTINSLCPAQKLSGGKSFPL